MAITTTSFEIIFKLASKEFQITDVAPYPGANLADISTSIIITDPSGDESGPFIVSTDLSLDRNINVNIPLGSNGEVLNGRYTFEYTAIDSSDSSTATETKTFDFCYKSPEVDIQMEVDCIKPELSSTDISDYRVDGVTPTITRTIEIHYPLGTGLNPITATTQAITTDVFYTKTHQSKVTSSLVYEYPDGFSITDVVVGSDELNVTCDNSLCDLYCCLLGMYQKYKDAQSSNRTLASELKDKWLKAEGIRNRIVDSYNCNQEENVSDLVKEIMLLGDCQEGCGCSDGDEPSLIGAIASTPVYPTTSFQGGTSSGEANTASNVGSGEGTFAQKLGEDLQFKSLKAGSGVSLLSDGDSITISSFGGGSGSTVTAGLKSTVTSTTNGGITTYNVGLDQATSDKIDSLKNTIVQSGTGTGVVETAGPNGEAVYTVSSSVSQSQGMELTYRFALSSTAVPAIELVSEISEGSKFQAPTMTFVRRGRRPRNGFVPYNEITTINDLKSSNLKIKAEGVLTDVNDNYIPTSVFSGVYDVNSITLPNNFVTDVLELGEESYTTTTAFISEILGVVGPQASPNEFMTSIYKGDVTITYDSLLLTSREYFYFTIKLK